MNIFISAMEFSLNSIKNVLLVNSTKLTYLKWNLKNGKVPSKLLEWHS